MTPSDFITGTVKGPGELPHEYLLITKDNKHTRIGEFVYYQTEVGGIIKAGNYYETHSANSVSIIPA